MLKVGSLFSGIGGIELGLEREGNFRTEWFVENDPHAQAVLRKNFPEANIYGDITKLDFKTVPKVDVLTGGFPCQDISNAGKRAGITGSRSSLWKYYAEAIRVLRPKFIIAENVSALINRGLDTVLSDLAALGYDAEWHCIPASSVGARHRRDRIFIIAYPQRDGQCAQRFESVQGSDCISEERQASFSSCRAKWQHEAGESCADVANAECERPSKQREHEQSIGAKESSTKKTNRPYNDGWWSVEPELGRVADGVPNRVDRIKCLGNAVVPQVAEIIGEAIIRDYGGKTMNDAIEVIVGGNKVTLKREYQPFVVCCHPSCYTIKSGINLQPYWLCIEHKEKGVR